MHRLSENVEDYFATLKQTLDRLDRDQLRSFVELLLKAREEGKTIFIMGNGGSAATASHFMCDFNKGLSRPGQKRFKVICLNDNVPSLMAYANDQSYEDIFIEQLKNFFQLGDVVIGISGSGNSMNVLKAIAWANKHGGRTVCFVGYDGGKLKKMASVCVHSNVDNMQISEDMHMIITHCAMHISNLILKSQISENK